MAAIVPARRALSWQLTDTNNTGVVRERYWITFQPGEIRTCTSCHGINTVDQANHTTPTNTPAALVDLLKYWKTNTATDQTLASIQGTNHFEITFRRRPAESGVTYQVQASADLATWSNIATYSGTNIVITPQAIEISRTGAPTETVKVRDALAASNQPKRFMRVLVTKP